MDGRAVEQYVEGADSDSVKLIGPGGVGVGVREANPHSMGRIWVQGTGTGGTICAAPGG